MIRIYFIFFIIIFLSKSTLLLADDLISFKIVGISGLAFIEKPDVNKSLRAFRGSEVHTEHRLRTSSNTQIEIVISKNANKVADLTIYENTMILINDKIYKKDNNKISISLIEGNIKVNTIKDIEDIIEVHTATTSSIIYENSNVDFAFAENGSTLIVSSQGKLNIITDNKETVINKREAYITTIDSISEKLPQNYDNSSQIFLNSSEEVARENISSTIDNLLKYMENLKVEQNTNFTLLKSIDKNSSQYSYNLELKAQRMLSANEGYYNNIIKLINFNTEKKLEMLPYARKSLTIYIANQRNINKMYREVIKLKK